MVIRTLVTATLGVLAVAASATAQTTALAGRTTSQQRELRYQIAVMEGVLKDAVEHGAAVTRDRLQAVVPAGMLLTAAARARGFRLEGYGIFFDVEVPDVEGSLPWIFRTLDQNDLGLDSALKALRSHIEASKDVNLRQAFERIELQVAPMAAAAGAAPTRSDLSGARTATGSAAAVNDPAPSPGPAARDTVLRDPEEAYRIEVTDALMNAMLEHSRGLDLGPAEFLTVAARRNNDRPRLAPADTDARTVVLRVRGGDLTAFLAGQISREDARKRIDVKVH
jgi:hypothetical protein